MAGFALAATARGSITWEEVRTRLPLGDIGTLPIPLPPVSAGEVEVEVDAYIDTEDLDPEALDIPAELVAEGDKALLRLRLDYRLPDDVRLSLPGLRLGPDVRLEFLGAYADAAGAESELSNAGGRLNGMLRFEVQAAFDHLVLPDDLAWVKPRLGDANGHVTLRLTGRVDTAGAASFDVQVLDIGRVDLGLPGVPDAGTQLAVSFDSITGGATWDGDRLTGNVVAEGRFRFRPRLTGSNLPAMGVVERALAGVDVEGTATGTITFGVGTAALDLECSFVGADVDLVSIVKDVVRGLPPPAETASPVDADLADRVPLAFRMVAVRAGFTPEKTWFGVQFVVDMAGFEVPMYLSLGTEDIAFGFGWLGREAPAATIPLKLPHVRRSDFEPLIETFKHRLETADAVERYETSAGLFVSSMEALTGAGQGGPDAFTAYEEGDDQWVLVPEPPAPTDDRLPLRFAIGRTADTNEFVLAAWLGGGWRVLVARPRVELRDVSIRMPWRNPRDVQIGGSAGLSAGGPLRSLLDEISLRIALTADMVYLSLDTERSPASIEIPRLLPGYGTGRVELGKVLLGFSYTRRSLAIAFAGSIRLPIELVDDLDTSEELGAGIRLPVQSRVMFRFDIMPVVVGKVVVPIPLIQFDVDLRRDVPHALRDPSRCEPEWDGLQLIVPNVARFALERVSYSPLILMHASSNSDFGGSFSIGDEDQGFTVVLRNGFWAYGLDSWPAMIFAGVLALPFADDACLHVAFGGFGLNINLQRPIPSPSPFALFELLALLSDPVHYEVAPRGDLADSVRVSLTDASLVLPEPVRTLFPEAVERLERRLDLTINLGTYVRLLQVVAQAIEPLATAALRELRRQRSLPSVDAEALKATLRSAALALDPRQALEALLAALPAPARRMQLFADLGGFQARVALVFATADDVRAALRPPSPPAQPAPSGFGGSALAALEGVVAAEPPEVWGGVVWRPGPDVTPFHDPEAEGEGLLDLPEFVGFRADDVAAAEAVSGGVAGLVVGATVRVLDAHHIRFLGFLRSDGGFELVSRVGLKDLQFALPWIGRQVRLTLSGRARLTGRPRQAGVRAMFSVAVGGTWDLGDALTITVYQAELQVDSRGDFRVHGSGAVRFFDAVLSSRGGLDITPHHCVVEVGQFQCKVQQPGSDVPLVFVDANVARGSVGPGRHFDAEGTGSLSILGRSFTHDVHVRAGTEGAFFAGRLVGAVPLPGVGWDAAFDMEARGEFGLRPPPGGDLPRLAVRGDGTVTIADAGLSIEGSAGLDTHTGGVSIWAAGRVQWYGHEWLNGRVEATASGGLSISGEARSSWGFNRAKLRTIPGLDEVDIGELVVHVAVAGKVTFLAGSTAPALDLDGEWTVALRPPVGTATVPAARGSFSVSPNEGMQVPLFGTIGPAQISLTYVAGTGVVLRFTVGGETTDYPLTA